MPTDPESDTPGGQQRRRIARRVFAATAWIVAGLMAVGALAVLLLLALINVDGVHRYLLGLAQRKASSALGVPVTLENFSVDVPALQVDLYGLTIDGAAPYPTPPLLQVNHIEASARIISLFHLKWYLNRVQVDHPVVYVIENRRGRSNLPVARGGTGKSNVDLFSLAIRHAVLDGGEIYVNDRPQTLDARLTDLEMSAEYHTLAHAYAGTLAYTDGEIQFGAMRPLSHGLDASFTYSSDTFRLNRATVTSGNSRIVVAGDVTNFSRPEVHAQYDATIDGGQMRAILRQAQVPSGMVEARGRVTYVSAPSEPFIETVSVNGDASSRALTLASQGRKLVITNLITHYSAANGILTVRDLHANVLGGGIAVEGTERLAGSHQGGSAKAAVHGISLREAQSLLASASAQPVAVRGTLNGTGSASWGAAFKNLEAKVDAFTTGRLIHQLHGGGKKSQIETVSASQTGMDNSSVPLQAQVHALYTRNGNRLEIQNSFLRAQGLDLEMNGTVGTNSSLAVNVRTNDLGEVKDLSSLFAAQSPSDKLRSLALAGEASFRGTVTGSTASPRISGYLEASNLVVNGSRWKTFHANLAASPSFAQVENAYLEPATQGEIRFGASTRLDRWSFNKNSSVQASLNMSRIKASELLKAAKETVPATGVLDASVQVRGTVAMPSGNGTVRLSNATAYRQPVKSALLSFSTSGGEIRGKAVVEIAGGAVKASASVKPAQRTFSGQIHSTGIQIGRFRFVKSSDAGVTGVLHLDASGHGSFENPNLTVNVKIPKASVEGQDFSGINLGMNLENRVARARFSSTVADAPIQGRAEIALTGNYPASLSLDTQTVSLQPLLALYAPAAAEGVGGQTQVHLQFHGPLKEKQAIVGELTIPLLKLSYKNAATLAATAPIRIDYQNGILRLQPATIRGTDADLQLQGDVPVFSKAPMSLQVLGSVNLEIAQVLYPDLQSSGMARINIRSGAASAGGMSGLIEIANASLSSATLPVGLQNGNGIIAVSGTRIDISKLTGTIGGGTVTARGGVSLRPKLGFDLGLTATNVRMLYPQGMRESLNASLRLTGSTERALLGGTVGISDVSFAPSFDLMSMAGQFSSGVAAPTAPGFSQNLRLNIAVHSTNTLNPTSKTMSVAGSAALSVRGTAAHPALIGRVNLTGGSMMFHGDRFVLTSGTVQFVNPNQIRPVLNVSLTTTIQQYDIDLRFTGPVDQLHFEYTSNPSLPQADIISLLAFGATTEAQAANPTSANLQAESLIASGVSSQVTSRISRIAGISQLSISPVLTSGTAAGPPGAVITIRQQVTGNLFITFSTNVASTQDETIQGEYRLSPRVSVSATRDPNGGFAIDTLIKKSW